MRRICTADLRHSPGAAGEKIVVFETAQAPRVSVYFDLDNVVSPLDEVMDRYTKLATQALEQEIKAGRQLQSRYKLRDGKLFPR